MDYIVTTLDNLVHQTAFFNLTWGKLPDDRSSLFISLPGYSQGI